MLVALARGYPSCCRRGQPERPRALSLVVAAVAAGCGGDLMTERHRVRRRVAPVGVKRREL